MACRYLKESCPRVKVGQLLASGSRNGVPVPKRKLSAQQVLMGSTVLVVIVIGCIFQQGLELT